MLLSDHQVVGYWAIAGGVVYFTHRDKFGMFLPAFGTIVCSKILHAASVKYFGESTTKCNLCRMLVLVTDMFTLGLLKKLELALVPTESLASYFVKLGCTWLSFAFSSSVFLEGFSYAALNHFHFFQKSIRLLSLLWNTAYRSTTDAGPMTEDSYFSMVPFLHYTPNCDWPVNIECTICTEPCKETSSCRRTFCGHIFHAGCLDPWIKRSGLCPVCSSDMSRVLTTVSVESLIYEDIAALLDDLYED